MRQLGLKFFFFFKDFNSSNKHQLKKTQLVSPTNEAQKKNSKQNKPKTYQLPSKEVTFPPHFKLPLYGTYLR